MLSLKRSKEVGVDKFITACSVPNHTPVGGPRYEGFKILCDNTAPSALYEYGHSFTGPRCHPGTRIAVQDYIFKWLDDPEGQIAMWMNGPLVSESL